MDEVDDGWGTTWEKCGRPDCDLHVVERFEVRCTKCDDIVVRLRQYRPHYCWTCSEWGCYDNDGKNHWKVEQCVCGCHRSPAVAAADEIERLRAELESVRVVV